jgi:hypothetical protein
MSGSIPSLATFLRESMKFILLFLVVSCTIEPQYDYMFTINNETWVCDEVSLEGYTNCETVLSRKKSDRIYIGRDVSVISVKEETK